MDEVNQQTIEQAGKEAREVISQLLVDLKDARGADDKFFPHGVELIDVEVSIGAKEKSLFSFHIKVAGPKPPTEAEQGDVEAV